jgi:hypothetical protein
LEAGGVTTRNVKANDGLQLIPLREDDYPPEWHTVKLLEAAKEKRLFSIKRQGERQPGLFGQTFNAEKLPKGSATDSRLSKAGLLLLALLVAVYLRDDDRPATHDLIRYQPKPRRF